jgi:ferredoxin-NADP reductase
VTPLVAMCEEFAAKGEKRPVWFFHGSESEGALRFRERLEQLPAKVVFTLEKPGEGWRGERGFVNRKMLERYLPENYRELEYFVCGPEAMMDAMELVLAEMGVPRSKVHTERFVLV